MKEVLLQTKKATIGLGLLGIALLSIVAINYYNPAILDQFGATSSTATAPEYSFDKPGQLKNTAPETPNKFAGLSAEELNQSALDIMQQADAIVAANPVQAEPITPQQQAQLDQRIQELEHKIQQLEQDLKQP